MTTVIADGDPTKDFFVHMITKDIGLEDCIFDLIDNAIDGARKQLKEQGKPATIGTQFFVGCKVEITCNGSEFRIKDNGSGISVEAARQYALRFGKQISVKPDADHGIGLYGIGMKRAMFKIGKRIELRSSTTTESFTSTIDVESWLKEPKWDFTLEVGSAKAPGTELVITALHSQVAKEFGDQSFVGSLINAIGRDYSLLIQDGIVATVNDHTVKPFVFSYLVGHAFSPFKETYTDEGVVVTLVAGMAQVPPDNNDPIKRKPDEYYGWFVVCNERVVIASDKTEQTGWDNDGFQEWHNQYNGFLGILTFDSNDPRKLPWTTTKRGIEQSSPIFKRALVRMKSAADAFIQYTNRRKSHIEEAKEIEQNVKPIPLREVVFTQRLMVPTFTKELPKVRMTNISYAKPITDFAKVKAKLGGGKNNREVGIATFDYYMKNEVEE